MGSARRQSRDGCGEEVSSQAARETEAGERSIAEGEAARARRRGEADRTRQAGARAAAARRFGEGGAAASAEWRRRAREADERAAPPRAARIETTLTKGKGWQTST